MPTFAIIVFLVFVIFICLAIFISSGDEGQVTRRRAAKVLANSNRMTNRGQKEKKIQKNLIDEFRADEQSKSVRILRKGQKLLKSSDLLQNSEMRLTLAQAGYRGAKPIATFIIMRFLAPPVIGIVTAIYIYFFLPHIAETPMRYILFVFLSVGVGYFAPVVWIKNIKNKRQANIKDNYPDMLDLILICAEAGMSTELAFRRVSEEIGQQCPELQDELELFVAELSYLSERRQAYKNLSLRIGLPQIRALTSMLIQSESYGMSLSKTLRTLAEEGRFEKLSDAERKAASLPSKLTVPMMIFFMPALFVVIMTPAALQIMDNL